MDAISETMKMTDFLRGKLRLAAMLLCVALGVLASRADDIFADLADDPMVESTYVSGRFSKDYSKWNTRTGKPISLPNGFKSLYTYLCYSTESVQKAEQLLKNYLKKHPDLELTVRNKSGGEDYRLYQRFDRNDNVIELVMWSADLTNYCEIVVINSDDKKKSN